MTIKIFFGNKTINLTSKADLDNTALSAYYADLTEQQVVDVVKHFVQSATDESLNMCEANVELLLDKVLLSFKPIDAAGGLIENGKGELLVIYRRGKYDLPKGKRETNETNEQNALREVEEETGLSARIVAPLSNTYHIYQLANGQYCLKTTHWFRMKVDGVPTPTPQTEEDIAEAIWVSREQMKNLAPQAYLSLQDIFLNA